MQRAVLIVMFAACATDAADDDFWSDSVDDGGDPATLAGTAKRVAIEPGETTNAELVDLLPVARSEGAATHRVVMRTTPPNLAAGDRLIVLAEAQVTTRCDVGQTAPGCDYNPNVRAQLELDGRALATRTQSCTKADHHCMFVFTPADTSRVLERACDGCRVELVMWAWHPDARSGDQDKVLVGGNDGNFLDNGRVEQDQGRLMAVRERGIVAADRARRETSGGGDIVVGTNANPVVIFSHRVKAEDLRAGEQFVVEAKLVTEVSSRARVSTQLVLAKDPRATDGGLDNVTPKSLGEHNGINCTDGTSPCTLRKVAVFRADDAIAGAVHVNVVATSEVPGGGSARVVVRRGDSFVRTVRYSAAFRSR